MNQLLNKTTMVAALLRAVPVGMTVIFVLAVVLMNFLARITLVSLPWLALNAGITVSWVSFLFVDIVTRHFGAKAANMLSVVAIGVNLIVCFFSVVIGRLFDHPSLDMVVGGQWSILLASTIAYLVAALTNNYTNVFLGRRFFRQNPDGRKAFAVRSYISTFLSQCVDNFLRLFFGLFLFLLVKAVKHRADCVTLLFCHLVDGSDHFLDVLLNHFRIQVLFRFLLPRSAEKSMPDTFPPRKWSGILNSVSPTETAI